ncbi:SDR family oxidoreductase [Microvirga sp. SRT01]|nr:SDR family oxidoreductase [Microvirga sp. SRT01]
MSRRQDEAWWSALTIAAGVQLGREAASGSAEPLGFLIPFSARRRSGAPGSRCCFSRLVDYIASKGGIEQLTKVAALELGPHGIRVNCVAPGAIETDRTRAEVDDYAGRWSPITPLRRVGTVEDVAAAVVWFAGPESSFVSGQTLLVDGGVFSPAVWPNY